MLLRGLHWLRMMQIPGSQFRNITDVLPYNTASINKDFDCPKRIPRSQVEFLAKMLFMPSKSPPDSRLLKVAVVGFPNVGKSSLVNMLATWRVCAVSGKAHTTRSKQTVVFTKDNIQLVFVDLPGIVSTRQVRQFKLERTFIRDPHSAIFDSDLILVVVDASNKYGRDALDLEVLKVLHFFSNRESVLVLNKVDQVRGDPTRLLDTTRRLTGGIVSGTRSHCDSFANKFNQRALVAEDDRTRRRLSPEAIIFPLLPPEAHEAAQARLQHIERLSLLLSPPIQIESAPKLKCPSSPTNSYLSPPTLPLSDSRDDDSPQYNTECVLPDVKSPVEDDQSLTAQSPTETCIKRFVTEVEHQTIEDFFSTFKSSKNAPSSDVSALTLPKSDNEVEVGVPHEVERLEDMVDRVHTQMMLKSASKEEVAARRQQWRELGVRLQGVKHWEGFSQVFMVSSATGEGIDKLREYLLQRAKPDRQWLLSPSMVTDVEPSELVRMCVWAQCLDQLPQEIPYNIVVTVDECEHTGMAEGDDRIYVHVRLRCPNERSIKIVIGPNGTRIRMIASAVKKELSDLFQAPTVVKLTAEAVRPTRKCMRQLRAAKDFKEVFPNFSNEGASCDAPQDRGIEVTQI